MQLKYKLIFLAGLLSAAGLPVAFADQPSHVLSQARADLTNLPAHLSQQDWREVMKYVTPDSSGCFYAHYPSATLVRVSCQATSFWPPRPSINPSVAGVLPLLRDNQNNVGNDRDYVLQIPKIKKANASPAFITKTIGYFPNVTGVRYIQSMGGSTTTDGPNEYSLQLNTNANASTAACDGHPGCTVWQQAMYSTDYDKKGKGNLFIQYWLINYGPNCPKGWWDFKPDCYKNSPLTIVPDLSVTRLGKMVLIARAEENGYDSAVFIYNKKYYAISNTDHVLDISTVWKQSEFNIFGNMGDSQATFNSGSSLAVRVIASYPYQGQSTPLCLWYGSTGETNNLNAGDCKAVAGGVTGDPYIQFTESN